MPTQELAEGFLVTPDAATPGSLPGVLMIPDVWGLADHTRDLATRLSAEGFAVLAADPYRKTGPPEIATPEEALAWIRELSDPLVLETLAEARLALAAAGCPRIGVTGFCMGGMYTILAACAGGYAACVPFYGMLRNEPGLDPARKPRSALDALANLGCPLLGLYGAEDHLIPPADVAALEEALAKSGQPGEVRSYPGAGHAFMNETRPPMYRPDAAADAWPRMVAFLREHLAPL